MGFTKIAILFGVFAASSAASNNITSPPVTNWGVWGNFERCGFGAYAQGFQLKTEPNQFLGDDTALNAIRIFCGDPFRPTTKVITSTEGDFGSWGNVYTCYPGVLTGFRLRVEPDKGSGDDTASNNIRFTCSEKPNDYIEGDGMSWGDWSDAQHCYGGQGITGIQTQVEPYQSSQDDTMLNNVRFECTDIQKKHLEEGYRHVEKFGAYPEKVSPIFAEFIRSAMDAKLKEQSLPPLIKSFQNPKSE